MPVNRIGTSALDYMRGNLIRSPNVLGPNACTVSSADILRWAGPDELEQKHPDPHGNPDPEEGHDEMGKPE
jgi:hypothetical protein